ncbi:MAG: hypothetical protein GEU79_05765 [Acidimicrobiia bacterium]|nr:hypothetical protein [Acidimicrobiia bacterium]
MVVETSALVQRRLGMAAADHFHEYLLPVIDVTVVEHSTHDRGVERGVAPANENCPLWIYAVSWL